MVGLESLYLKYKYLTEFFILSRAANYAALRTGRSNRTMEHQGCNGCVAMGEEHQIGQSI